MADGDQDPDDELDLDVDPPAEADLEDVGLDSDEQDETPEDPPDETPAAAQPKDQPAQDEPRQPSRRDRRIATLTREVQERDRRLAETNRRIDDLIARQAQPQHQGETPEQRAQRFAIMTPDERIAETLRESEQRHNATLSQMQMQMLDTADRTSFQTKAAVDPLYAKWGPKVEGKLAELRAKGNNVEREVLLKFLIGEAALERRGSKEGRQEVRQAARRVQSQRTRPGNSGGDTQAQRRQTTSLERRLENEAI
jgi:hypothetical protein